MRAAHTLLVQGIDRAWTVPTLDSVEEFVDIAVHGTINEWRHHVAMIIADPWSPYVSRIIDLAQQVGTTHAAAVVTTIVDLCREDHGATGRPRTRPATRRYRYPDGRAAP